MKGRRLEEENAQSICRKTPCIIDAYLLTKLSEQKVAAQAIKFIAQHEDQPKTYNSRSIQVNIQDFSGTLIATQKIIQ